MNNPVIIGNATLYLGDCRESVACRACDWVWKPAGTRTTEPCPKCGKVRDVRKRKYAPRNVDALKAWRAERPGYSTEHDRRARRQALLLVGRGVVACVRCGCDRSELIEINHKEGGGGKELRGVGHKFYRDIAKLRRPVDDLELLCRPCNAIHYLELKHGPLPFRVVWGESDAS